MYSNSQAGSLKYKYLSDLWDQDLADESVSFHCGLLVSHV